MNVADCILLALTQFPLLVAMMALPRILSVTRGKRLALHILFPLSQGAFIGVQMIYALRSCDWTYAAVLVCCSIICAIIGTTLVRHLVASEQREEQSNRLHLVEVQTEAQRRRMQEIDEDVEGVRDDYRRFLRKLDDLDQALRNGSPVSEVEHNVHVASNALGARPTRLCDNLIVDALLSMKIQEAQRKGIAFRCNANVGKATPLDDVELCAVFANLCDNALHACERMREGGVGAGSVSSPASGTTSDSSRPWIRVQARIDDTHCMITVANACPAHMDDTSRRSGRTAIPEHGWGMQILESIASKHKGTFSSAYVHDRWLALFSC